MDERQQHLVAAAEAMRTWIHKQRAMWAEGYPQSLRQVQPQFAVASAAVVARSASIVSAPAPAIVEPWTETENGPSWWQGITDRFSSTLQGTTTFVQTSWRMLAGIAVIVMLAGAVRFAWPSMKEKMSSNVAAGRQAIKSQTQALSQKVGNERPSPTKTKVVAAAAKGTGQLQVESSPTGARVLIDGKDRGMTPLTIDSLAAGSHKVMIRGADGSVQRTVAITAGELLQVSESIYSGWLHVSAPFEVQISEGRRSIRLDDSNQVLLSPGPHDVRFENRALGLREVRHLEIRPGETTAISLELPVSRLSVTASEPATVAIDGQQVGETPLTDHAVPVGTRDVTVTSASGQVRHQTITVKVQPAQIDIDFSKP